jgi:anti-sigma B factor antagonist
MKISERTQDGVKVYELRGKIMGGEPATLLRGKVVEAIEAGERKFVLDLSGVDWMNSIGLGMLVALLNTVSKSDGQLQLANIDKIEKVLLITRLVTIFQISDNTDDAVAALTK